VIVAFRKIATEVDWDWFTCRNSIQLLPDMTSILAYNVTTNAILAGCVMDNWTESSCQIHFCIDNPMAIRHKFFEEIAEFVYDTAGRTVMHGLVPADNLKALALDKKIGFREVTRLTDAFKLGVDYVLLEMRKEDCNFYTEDT
jgi:RimJ/RimL family protein N-acetyltransferase